MFQSIQVCRAVAALLVVMFHTGGNLMKDKYFGAVAAPIERTFWFAGEAGVAFFFVLSGFIIAHVHWQDIDRPERLRPYVRKRLVRIYPTYFIVFLGVYGLAWLTPSLRGTVPDDPMLLLKALSLMPLDAAVVGGTGAPVLAVAWSLQYEMVFYTVFALGLIDRRLLYAAGLAYALNFIAQALLPAYAFPRSFFASHLILLFGMGMLAARAVRSSLSLPYCGYIAVAAATAFFGVGMVATMNRVGYNKAPFDLAYGAVSMVLVWALVRYEQSRPSLAVLRSFALMGASSYALYLIHFPLIAILSKVAVAVLPKSSVGALTAFVAMVGVCAVVSMAFHAGVERRVIRWFRPGNRSRASAS